MRGFGGNTPNKLWPVLKARGVSLQATRAIYQEHDQLEEAVVVVACQ